MWYVLLMSDGMRMDYWSEAALARGQRVNTPDGDWGIVQ